VSAKRQPTPEINHINHNIEKEDNLTSYPLKVNNLDINSSQKLTAIANSQTKGC
jgi:hypothetical protein